MPIIIDKETGKRFNPNAVSADRPFKGRARLDTLEGLAELGIIEIEDDIPPDEYLQHPDWYSVMEDWETTQRPYTIYVRKKVPELRKLELAKLTAEYQQDTGKLRDALILVVVSNGGDVKKSTIEKELRDRKEQYTVDVAALASLK